VNLGSHLIQRMLRLGEHASHVRVICACHSQGAPDACLPFDVAQLESQIVVGGVAGRP